MFAWDPRFLFFFKPLIRVSRDVNWRFGKPYRWRDFDISRIWHLIHPGMVILSRKEHQLANYFIPGYWTHTSLVMSREQVIEATAEGVVMNDLYRVFRCADDFVLLKPRFCDASVMERACCHAREALGKPYSFDFSFDDNKTYCSALVYITYMRSCGLLPGNTELPQGFNDLFEGKVISPDDLYRNSNAWEVVYQPG